MSLDAGTPASKNGVFKTNFPIDGGKFGRTRFAERRYSLTEWHICIGPDLPVLLDRLPTDVSKPIQVDLPISHAGAFVYWVEYDGVGDGERVKGREGYFNIDPALRVMKRTSMLSEKRVPLPSFSGGGAVQSEYVHLPRDGLAVLTVVSKRMGSLDQWKPHLQEAKDRGYNMLHYTPLQQRGESQSPYSLADQTAYDAELFEANWKGSKEDGQRRMKEMLKVAKVEYGLLSLTDVVLNHTANNSPWLIDHPEAGKCFFTKFYSSTDVPKVTAPPILPI